MYPRLYDFPFFLGENYYVYDLKETEGRLDVFVKSSARNAVCPECGKESMSYHSTYKRTIQDCPLRGKQTFLHVTPYMFDCQNPDCGGKTFTEALPFARMSQIRTDALNTMILGISMFLSNEGASKVLALLGVTVSNDSIQRIIDRIEFADDPDVEAVGIDDVAKKKGHSYATAIYDLKTHKMIALLDGRDGKTLKDWLENHKKIRIVARDRASAYAAAIGEVLPECVQVADRFHLLQNLLTYLNDIFKEEVPSAIYIKDGKVLEKPPEKKAKINAGCQLPTDLQYDNTPPKDQGGTEVAFNTKTYSDLDAPCREMAEKRKKNRN